MSNQATKTGLTSPLGLGESAAPKPATVDVEVSYGPGFGKFKVMPGQTVKELLADTKIEATVGYGNIADANTILVVDGKQVKPDHVIKGGETVEVLKLAGQKADGANEEGGAAAGRASDMLGQIRGKLEAAKRKRVEVILTGLVEKEIELESALTGVRADQAKLLTDFEKGIVPPAPPQQKNQQQGKQQAERE